MALAKTIRCAHPSKKFRSSGHYFTGCFLVLGKNTDQFCIWPCSTVFKAAKYPIRRFIFLSPGLALKCLKGPTRKTVWITIETLQRYRHEIRTGRMAASKIRSFRQCRYEVDEVEVLVSPRTHSFWTRQKTVCLEEISTSLRREMNCVRHRQ